MKIDDLTARTSNRREFLQRSIALTGAAALPAVIPAAALGRDGATPPSAKITLGVIGIGPRMTYDLSGVLPKSDVRCVAICDVQASRREAAKKLVDQHYGNKDCALYRDFRELLGRADIDAVMIGTGDRWHAPASILAAKAGKDVYSEKPCGLTIGLCQALDDTIRLTQRVFQAGTQRRSLANFQAAIQLAQSGKLGKIHTLVASAYTPSIETTWLPGEPAPPRDVVDWDLWLGPAPWRPYNHAYVAGQWRGYWDFDSGARLLDWGAHTVDLCQWANAADDTTPIEFEPAGKTIIGRYANGVKLVIDCLETPFGKRPGWVQSLGTCPVRFVGDEGWVETGDSGGIEVHPPSLKAEIQAAARKRQNGLDVATHTGNFFDCVRSRGKPAANSQVMRHSHIACHAAALSWVLNRKLKFDPAKEEFVGDDEANGLRSRPARAPWIVESSSSLAGKRNDKPRPLFDGRTFDGWEGDTKTSFRIEDGAIVGGSLKAPVPHNEFLCTRATFANFILRAECKLVGPANGGIQFRSQRVPDNFEVSGYQADMSAERDGGYWGCLYDESRRNRVLVRPERGLLLAALKPADWNRYEIRCEGDRIRLYLNGVQTVDFIEKDDKLPRQGILGLQIHGGGPSEAWYRNITIEELA